MQDDFMNKFEDDSKFKELLLGISCRDGFLKFGNQIINFNHIDYIYVQDVEKELFACVFVFCGKAIVKHAFCSKEKANAFIDACFRCFQVDSIRNDINAIGALR